MKKLALLYGMVALAGASVLIARPSVKVELPAETAVFKPAPGVEIANAQCLVCHSVEYVTTQPPLPRAFWSSSVKKMIEKYAAAVPTEQIEPLVDYLVHNYGMSTNGGGGLPPVATAPSATPAPTPTDGPGIARRYGCLNCHTPAEKLVGPPYRDIATKYVSDSGARVKITDQIHNGGTGKWGVIVMPPFPMVTQQR